MAARTLSMHVPFERPAADVVEAARVAAARQGDGGAFRDLVEPHLPLLHRIAYRMCGDPMLAEDAVQETLELAFRRLASFRPGGPFRVFLAAVAARQAHTLARGERRRSRRETHAPPACAPASAEAAAETADAARRIREALCALPQKRRTAALLYLDAGLTHREIAEALDTSEGAARVLVHRAIGELRTRLGPLLAPDDEGGGR